MSLMHRLILCGTIMVTFILPAFAGGVDVFLRNAGAVTGNTVTPQFQVVNNSTAPVQISTIRLSYYMFDSTLNVANVTSTLDWGKCGSNYNMNANDVHVAFSRILPAITTDTKKADVRCEVTFSQNLTLGVGEMMELHFRFYSSDWSHIFAQTDDWSFNNSSSFSDANTSIGMVVGDVSNTGTPVNDHSRYPMYTGAGDSMKLDGKFDIGRDSIVQTSHGLRTYKPFCTTIKPTGIHMSSNAIYNHHGSVILGTPFSFDYDDSTDGTIHLFGEEGLFGYWATNIGKGVETNDCVAETVMAHRLLTCQGTTNVDELNAVNITSGKITSTGQISAKSITCPTITIPHATLDTLTAMQADINGTVRCKQLVVTNKNWADYVFEKDYPLMPLSNVESYIKKNGHLPGVPSATAVADSGVDISAMQTKMMEKIEELTLHVIRIEKENASLRVAMKAGKRK